MLNAFCRVAPSVLFNFPAIFVAGVFLFAIALNPRTSVAVQARRFFDSLAIELPRGSDNNTVLLSNVT
jgi:hypothetical protein